MRLLIASNNPHKIREIKAILKDMWANKITFDLFSLKDFPNYKAPEESGSSFEENALIKATTAARKLGLLTIADDSGLVVPFLGGAPGIHSARFAGISATDIENRKKLLLKMLIAKEEERYAYYECWLALVSPEGFQFCTNGLCEGSILEEEHGCNGFGYDSLFLKHEYGKTFAELNDQTKNRVSHRRKAFDKMGLTLENLANKLNNTQNS